MSKESGIYTEEELNDLDKKLSYMLYGQGFVVCILDSKHTRRRTLANTLSKLGVDNVVEADSYEKALVRLAKYKDNQVIVITDLIIGKSNGLRVITSLMLKFKGLSALILSDKPHPALKKAEMASKAIAARVRPLQDQELKDIITSFGVSLQKP